MSGTTNPSPVAATSATASDEPQALVASFLVDPPADSPPRDLRIRLTGRLSAASGDAMGAGRRSFVQEEVIQGAIPAAGPLAVTCTVPDVAQGEWTVDAVLVADGASGRSTQPGKRLDLAAWSWTRWRLEPVQARPVASRWALLAPLASKPAVLPGIYTVLAIVGIVVALGSQVAILSSLGNAAQQYFAASIVGLFVGLAGAKVWYAILHPDESIIRGGWAVDGFLIVAPLATAVALSIWGLRIGLALDTITPGIFFAVAIGRVGCFLTGCCAGRLTAARWGIWSSDRRVGARRVPTQLLESLAGLTIGVVSAVAVVGSGATLGGAVFVAAFLAYALVRQGLLRLRVERRRRTQTIPLTAGAAVAVAAAVIVLVVTQRT